MLWSTGIGTGTDRHHNRPTLHLAPVLQRDEEPITETLDRRNVRLVNVGYRPLLEPEAILDERRDRYGIGAVVLRVLQEARKPVVLARIGEVGGPPMRS